MQRKLRAVTEPFLLQLVDLRVAISSRNPRFERRRDLRVQETLSKPVLQYLISLFPGVYKQYEEGARLEEDTRSRGEILSYYQWELKRFGMTPASQPRPIYEDRFHFAIALEISKDWLRSDLTPRDVTRPTTASV